MKNFKHFHYRLITINFVDVIDIYEPDMYCNVKEVSWLEDTNRTHNNAKCLHVVKDANYLDTLGICPFLILKYLTNDETLMTNVGLKEGLKDKTFICDVRILA